MKLFLANAFSITCVIAATVLTALTVDSSLPGWLLFFAFLNVHTYEKEAKE